VIVWFLDNSIARKSPEIQGKPGFWSIYAATGTPTLRKSLFSLYVKKKSLTSFFNSVTRLFCISCKTGLISLMLHWNSQQTMAIQGYKGFAGELMPDCSLFQNPDYSIFVSMILVGYEAQLGF